MKTFLYVEETENALANALIKRRDIYLILIRFSNCNSFSKKHIFMTKDIPTFIIDKSAEFMKECVRLDIFLKQICDKVDVFYNDSEFNQIYIQKVARQLHFPGALTQLQADIVRDKFQMKDFINRIGLSCPKYEILNSYEDALKCAKKWGYPFIIKWRMGVSSIEVYKIESGEQLEKLSFDYTSQKYMAEQFRNEKIWCIDAIVRSRKVIQNFYTWLPFTNLDFAENKKKFVQLAVGYSQKSWHFDPKEITQTIVSELDLGSGYLHLEVFVTENGNPSICEFAWRTPGEHMLQNFTILYGENIEDYLINTLLGIPVQPLPEFTQCVADVFLPMTEGKIRKISSIEDLKVTCDLRDGEIFYKCGDVLKSRHKYTDSTGWVQVSDANIDNILIKINQVYLHYQLETEVMSDK